MKNPVPDPRTLMTLTACAECDLLLEDVPVPAGGESLCPRCGHTLREGRPDSVWHALLLSSIGLLLFGGAIGLPLLSMSMVGLRQEASLAQTVLALADVGFREVSIVVALCAMIAPFLNLWLLFTVSLILQLDLHPRWLPALLRINHRVREWGMLEVFLIGVVVSVVKLHNDAELLPGNGLYCFIGLMLATLLLNTTVDEHEFWQVYERRHRVRQAAARTAGQPS